MSAALASAAQDPDPEVRSSALFAVSEFDTEDALDRLVTGTGDSEWMVRIFAVTLLGRYRDARAIARLDAVLANDVEGMVREAAASSLGELGDIAALESLRRAAAEDPDREVRKAAEKSVKRLESSSA